MSYLLRAAIARNLSAHSLFAPQRTVHSTPTSLIAAFALISRTLVALATASHEQCRLSVERVLSCEVRNGGCYNTHSHQELPQESRTKRGWENR